MRLTTLRSEPFREGVRWPIFCDSRRNGGRTRSKRSFRLRAFWLKRVRVISLVNADAGYLGLVVTHPALPANILPIWRGYIVPWASQGLVTKAACHSRPALIIQSGWILTTWL